MTDTKKPDDTAENPEQVKLDSTVGTSVPEPAATAVPEPAGTAETAPNSAVPIAVERVNVSVVEVPMEIGQTKPLELPTRAPARPTDAADDAKPDDARTGAKPDDAKTGAKPDDAKTGAKPDDAKTGAKPDDAKTGAKPDDAKTGAKPDDAKTGAKPDEPKLAPQPWPPPATAVDATSPATADDVLADEIVLADGGSFGDDFMLADEMVPAVGLEPPPPAAPAPVPLIPNPPVLPSPQEAALEAARIVSQMVDIDSESGAVIAAAAAAGAAIEAAVAAHKATAAANAANEAAAAASAIAAGEEPAPRSSATNLRVPPSLTELAAGSTGHDPTTTVRLSRDRILQALAAEEVGVPLPPSQAPGVRIRARTEPGIDQTAGDEGYEEFDPVAIAAAAISRLRQRARTDLAELRVHYHRHDVLVLVLAFVIIVIIGRCHKNLVTPPNEVFSQHGLTFAHSTAWLKPEPLPMVAPRLVRDASGAQPTKDEDLYHVELSAIGSQAKLEVLIDKKPAWSNIVTGLELDRRSRWGELYSLDDSSVRSIAGHDWLRTSYRYAHAEKDDVPRIDRALEYATIDRDQIYVITIFGSGGELAQIEEVLAPSLRVQSQTALPLVPETGRFAQKKYPNGVGRAFASTVMVVVADLIDGRLKARGGGSGVVVGADGSILTNYHVLHDKDGHLHDTFVIGRFGSLDRAPQLQCAGRPNRSKLLREMDLALIKCDMDLDGRTWSPAQGGMWPTLPEARASDIKMGQRLWVLGYPDVGGGGLRWSTGEVEGWTGEDGAQGKDFLKTDASITHGNSGGPVIDDNGRLVGIAAAFRTRMTATGGVIETAQVGLVRPLQSASNLLAYAAAGWSPRENYTDVELTPTAIEAAAEGVRIYTTVVDDANESPIRDATVMVLKSGVNTATIDMNRLDDQAIAWGKTNALGEVRLKQLVPIPGNYTVMVIAPGYEPLIGESELHLDDKTPPSYDPWGKIGLRSR